MYCRLVLNRQRWIELNKCPNCPSSGGLSDTTEDFQNVIGQIYPKMSWVAQYQGINELIPGLYAMNVSQQSNSRRLAFKGQEERQEEEDEYEDTDY